MNSYPPELLAQLAPVMFVAGLNLPPNPAPPTSPTSNTPKPTDPFQVLSSRLREALSAQRKVAIWQPEKTKSFQVILVDKDVKFPPRKLVASDDPQYSSAHSPLSPLTPSSPLYPDGLIAPIWIRKHISLVPSVFVLFTRIFEYPPRPQQSPLDLPDLYKDMEREAEERRKDADLAADIAQRKKITNERGIKLTVVLMASRKMLDDPSLDARLTQIRRQSGLDSRAALFVLSPVSASELNEFVKSLQQALYEPAVEYYTAHSKRVRRKRNRHSQAAPIAPQPAVIGSMHISRPLRPEGWTVRYEYKMACFAEFRSEDEVALKHYQDAYEMLTIMFGSTAMLPPRTKRWAEAKVLADCINIKIVKLYLYNNEHALALAHHTTHVRQFGDFSRGWGIGEDTFEFWSWIARQHRVLAELLEQGTRTTLTIPVHKPISNVNPTASQQTLRTTAGVEYDALRSLGINPSHALQHPGFYYYIAARCTEIRRSCFLAIVEAERSQKPVTVSPGFTNEKKVEHLAIINELYTKAYELFKKYSPASNQGQGRLTLWIAFRIAQTYYEGGKHDMAVRFFERIAKTYRREKWNTMLLPLLSTWYACAQQLGDVELGIKLLVEMLGHSPMNPAEPESLQEDLVAVFKSTVPTTPDQALIVDLVEAQPIFDSNVIFWTPEVKVDEEAAFQLTLTAPSSINIDEIPFSRLAIYFAHQETPVIVQHSPSDDQNSTKVVDLGHIIHGEADQPVVHADLRWHIGAATVFKGTISSAVPTTLKVKSLVLTIEENGWKVEIPSDAITRRYPSVVPPRWLSSVDPPRFVPIHREEYHLTTVRHRPHKLSVKFHHQSPAYLDEDYPVEIEITNTDTRDLEATISFLLQPTETDNAVNWIVVDDEKSSSLIKGIRLGPLAPGASLTKTMHLFNTGAGGDRMVDVSIQTSAAAAAKEKDSDDAPQDVVAEDADTMEHLKMLVIPTVNPIHLEQTVEFRHSEGTWAGQADLQTFEAAFWDTRTGGEAVVTSTMTVEGPWGLRIESLILEKTQDTSTSSQLNPSAKVIDCSTDFVDEDEYPAEYIAGDEFGGSCRISYRLDDDPTAAIASPGRYALSWRRILPNNDLGSRTTSYFPLPSLRPPVDNLVALMDLPARAVLHEPFSLTLTIRNYHASRSANITVHLEADSVEGGLVVSGVRNGRVPVLLPGAEEKLVWRLVPIECGYVKLPRIRVIDRRKAIIQNSGDAGETPDTSSSGDVVRVVDARYDRREMDVAPPEDAKARTADEGPGTILVLP